MSEILIKALQNSKLYSHEVAQFMVIQTHLSWVILTGPFAYKIKKPLNLGFQDYTTLEKRKYYCELEISLNKRLAAQLYVEVVPITGSESHPMLGSSDAPFEYAIKMHQFPQENLLSDYASHQKLNANIFDALALQTAHFHHAAEICEKNSNFGTPIDVYFPIQDNFAALKTLPASAQYVTQIEKIEQWSQIQFEKLKPILSQRKEQGFIRACHGDLHLGNIVMLNQSPVIFDCIEFNESFRWTDVMNDVSFLAMDLDHKGYSSLSHFYVNKYFEYSHDYIGALLLKFYQSYRAMVRAKVTSFQIAQITDETPIKKKLLQELRELLLLGEQYANAQGVNLTITFGMSGSGKTVFTEQLLMKTGAIRLRSDVIRKSMYQASQKDKAYSSEATQAVYHELKSIAHTLLLNGHSVIIDAMCLKKWQRELFFTLSNETKAPLTLLAFDAPIDILQQRINERRKRGKDASEADLNVLKSQSKEIEHLTETEKALATYIDHKMIEELIHAYEMERHHS